MCTFKPKYLTKITHNLSENFIQQNHCINDTKNFISKNCNIFVNIKFISKIEAFSKHKFYSLRDFNSYFCSKFVKFFLIKKIVILCIFFATNFFFSQKSQAYYEKLYASKNISDPERLWITTSYIASLYSYKNFALGNKILQENISYAQSKSDFNSLSILYGFTAMSLRVMENSAEAKKSIELAKKFSQRTKNVETKGYVEYCEGWLYSRNGEQSKAVKNILAAIKWYESAPSSAQIFKRKSTAYNELSVIYANLGEYDLNEKYARLALSFAMKQEEPQVKFAAFMTIGNLNDLLFNKNPEKIHYRNLAERYFLQSIDIYNKNPNVMYNLSDLSFAANNLASLYLYSFPESYRDKALKYAMLANEAALKIGKADHIASTYGIMSEIFLADDESEKAIFYLLEAQKAIRKSTVIDRNIELNIYESLVDINEKQGNLSEAIGYQREYMNLFKNIYNQEKLEISKRLEAQFDKERQQQQYIKLQLESDKNSQKIALMQSLAKQREQTLSNLKLTEENQRDKLKFSELASQKNIQQLRLSQLETLQKNDDIINYKKILAYKEKINTYYIISISFFVLLIALLLFGYKQRIKTMKQRDELHKLAMEQEKQNSKISTLTALLKGQEQERGRLARDLHDGLGGLLSGTKLQLTHLNDQTNEKLQLGISKSIDQIDGAVTELRKVAHNLMPDLLLNYGLGEALQEFAIRMSNEKLEIHVQFLSYTNSLSQENQLLVYRIIQELVNNAVKHSAASQIIIQLVEDEENITMTVEDDGKGFNVNQLNLKKSAGFHNIQSRIQFLKGTITINSEVNVGTSVEMQFPKQ